MNDTRDRGGALSVAGETSELSRETAAELLSAFDMPRVAPSELRSEGLELADCNALIDLVCAAYKRMHPHDAEAVIFGGWKPGVLRTVAELAHLRTRLRTHGDDASCLVGELRREVRTLRAQQQRRQRAVHLLEEAAVQLGLRRDIYYAFPPSYDEGAPPKGGPAFSTLRTGNRPPQRVPRIEGETEEEHATRRAMVESIESEVGPVEESWPSWQFAQYDKPGGSRPSVKSIATRMIWDSLNETLRTRVPGEWEPYVAVAEILRWVGFDDVDSRYVRSTVVG